ncbi:High osmolarity signaling protein SHO1 [Spathaspora sp. JA1]|nr:High osmolarity signaling protein SHO1 [Spathaspora sp. JA1]
MGYSFSNLTGDSFGIATISFGIISWIVSIAGAGASTQKNFPNLSWWGLAYQAVIILVVLLLYCNNNIELYKFTLVGLISIAFVYNTNTVNNLIYNTNSSANLTCAAGSILLSILNLLWILYFGGHPESPTNQFIDSFSIRNQGTLHDNLIRANTKSEQYTGAEEMTAMGAPAIPVNSYNQQRYSSVASARPASKQYMSSSQLNGLENSSDIPTRDLTQNNKRATLYPESEIGTGVTFRYRAKALYNYEANPNDENEISFKKDEILEVDDIDGKWWQARRPNGQLGICPSNYVKLVEI